MKTLAQLVVVAALGYLFWVYGLPWVERQAGQARAPVGSPVRGAGGACVQMAARASHALHDRILDTSRGLLDDASWSRLVDEVGSELHQARSACSCRLESCARSREAIAALDALLSSARAAAGSRTSQSIPLDQSRRYERANQTLWEAYELAKEGR
jgi:hypothetical protein